MIESPLFNVSPLKSLVSVRRPFSSTFRSDKNRKEAYS